MKLPLIFLSLGWFCLLSTQSQGAVRKWNEKMQELSAVMEELLPELYRSGNPNPQSLEKNAKKLSELVHSLGIVPGGKSILPPDADPSLVFISGLLERESKRAYRALKQGHVEYAKGVLRATTGYCIACHSRNATGPDFPSITLTGKTESLSKSEKARFLAATRQFDGALEMYTSLLGDETFAKSRPIEWNRSIRHGLTLAVRAKQSPDKAIELLDAAAKITAPLFIEQNSKGWRASLVSWKAEKEKKATSEADLHKKAKQLIDQAHKMQDFPMDRSADILYLRATALLHDQLQLAPEGKLNAQAMFLLGKAYEVLGDLEGTPWHEMYYESCIRRAPNSSLAKSCYEAYEASLFFGYSGSGGFVLPEDVQATLSELRVIAMPKKK